MGQDFQPLAVSRFFVCIIQGNIWILLLLRISKKEYNCKVVYETFDSNETMYTKLQSGAEYDVIIPSDYMIERLISEDYLQPIDWKLITNKDKIIPKLLKNDFDPDNKYTVPYYWGTVGILYDKTVVDENDLKRRLEYSKK